VSQFPGVNDHSMSTASNPRITLELEPGTDPIRGSIEYADGSRQPFWGWLELSAELRNVAAGPDAQTGHINHAQTQRSNLNHEIDTT
jgi:hypothetical protein